MGIAIEGVVVFIILTPLLFDCFEVIGHRENPPYRESKGNYRL